MTSSRRLVRRSLLKIRPVPLGLVLVLLVPGRGTAQALQSQPATPVVQQAAPPAAGPASTVIYEDIEIMRRLMSRDLLDYQQAACAACHGTARTLAFSPDAKRLAVQADKLMLHSYGSVPRPPLLLDVDGTYLQGYGVVYHVTMPPMPPGKAQAVVPAAKAPSDWERTRLEVRGEKVDAPPSATGGNLPDLSDVLLKILADYGRNFANLAVKENVTIIVTFQPARDPHGRSTLLALPYASSAMAVAPGIGNGAAAKPNSYLPKLTPPAALDAYNFQTNLEGRSGAADFELLADLQLKQGRVPEAIGIYQRAVALQPDRKRLASLYQKLAQAYLKQDEKAVTDDMITKAITFLKMAQQSAQATSGVAPAPKSLPFKLILSAPKSWLDGAGKGMSQGEFRSGVRVEQVMDTEKHAEPKALPSTSNPVTP